MIKELKMCEVVCVYGGTGKKFVKTFSVLVSAGLLVAGGILTGIGVKNDDTTLKSTGIPLIACGGLPITVMVGALVLQGMCDIIRDTCSGERENTWDGPV